MSSFRMGLVVALLLLPAVTGCVTEGESLQGQCDLWTRNTSVDEGVRAQIHFTSEQEAPACAEVRFGGEQVAKVPLEGAGDTPLEGGNATVEWPEERITIRAEDGFSERWASEAVDLGETPHVHVRLTADEIVVQTTPEAPSAS